ncbi:hypothetical protein [Brevibacillus halotolerans]|uniref:hypothetical protein n=1 Tax=Brevibacillus halotolerans TaxID=1507437 RepID=UPI0015EECCE4|nr:hypothetical protein [Brevibacillus halotolerans]MBA4531061.1 hypothetical protein [Brevibacillus halotolerans]
MEELHIRLNFAQLQVWMKWYREGELHRLEQSVLYQPYKGVTAKVAEQEGETRTSLRMYTEISKYPNIHGPLLS